MHAAGVGCPEAAEPVHLERRVLREAALVTDMESRRVQDLVAGGGTVVQHDHEWS
jgi:hypothetical protein